MRRAARKDRNHSNIADAFLDVGATVEDTSHVGSGFPDMIVGYREQVYLVEVKDGELPPSRRRLTPDEEKFQAKWGRLYHVVMNADDALRMLGFRWAEGSSPAGVTESLLPPDRKKTPPRRA